MLTDHRKTLEILHDRIGLLLQVEGESIDKMEGYISPERLRCLVYNYLVQEEYSGEELDWLTDTIMHVALDRLVFIITPEDGRYSFEVRSLQEFSAARALMREEYDVVKERLRAIAPIPYWRNTLLFAIGQAFAQQNTRDRDMVMQLCRELDEADDILLARKRVGSRVALDMLEEGIMAMQPKYRSLVLASTLQLLRLSHLDTAERLVGLYKVSERELYRKAIQAVLGSGDFDEQVGLFLVLARLDERKEEWAGALQEQHWPESLAQQQLLIEKTLNFWINPWMHDMLGRVAGESGPGWVADNMRRMQSGITWLEEASRLRFVREKRVNVKGLPLSFSTIWQRVSPKLLASWPSQQLTHYAWLPFTIGQEFMQHPTPDTLADTLEALVQAGGWEPTTGRARTSGHGGAGILALSSPGSNDK